MKSLVVIDNEDRMDPAYNLAIEEFALRQMDPSKDYFLLYRNDPSVIVGRNQNILEEVNDFYIREKGIRIHRRLSGGGTVYHDPGNLNFSFITRYEQSRLHNFAFFNEPLVKVLQSLGVPAEMNDRNDILVDGRKISGSAQFSSRGRMFSHGTLLFDADLEEVERTLDVRMSNINSKSHKSVRSRVANISEFLTPSMDILSFRQRLLEGMIAGGIRLTHYKPTDSDFRTIAAICNDRYRTWEWNIGRSPRFQIVRSQPYRSESVTLHLEVNKGVIDDVRFTTNNRENQDFSEIGVKLKGIRYDRAHIDQLLNTHKHLLPEGITANVLAGLLYGEDRD